MLWNKKKPQTNLVNRGKNTPPPPLTFFLSEIYGYICWQRTSIFLKKNCPFVSIYLSYIFMEFQCTTANCQLPTANYMYWLLTFNCLLLTVNYLLSKSFCTGAKNVTHMYLYKQWMASNTSQLPRCMPETHFGIKVL